ncbi:hypothetical protein SAMN05444008_11279 [Cnuella takakiae]|uniref:Uncharacterized protein n=1 Tax=Cnuella takakiae TaxID=1302690 RepID=A0A1M5EK59_9BACT|nr:hypothetical protein [Cnuella takakiae]OLY91205.1 hypothetical protein BUE76_04295 [Cnuella takakiae]SHF79595.1 hypothetical protein SAMN05444008_11279 [Cnuella takakiae]
MERVRLITLLEGIASKAQDENLKCEIEAIIKELKISNDDEGEGKDNHSPPLSQNKTLAKRIADAVGKFFGRVGSSIAADQLSDAFFE